MASEAPATETERKDAAASISGHISVLTTGDHALLRRMYLTGKPAAEGVVIKLLHHAGVEPSTYDADYPAWRLLAHAAALLSGTGKKVPHDRRKSLGGALHDAGYSENRLLRLTAARGERLHDLIVLAVRMLAQAGQVPVNLWTLLDLARCDRAKAEAARLRIAQDYYRAAAPQEGNTK